MDRTEACDHRAEEVKGTIGRMWRRKAVGKEFDLAI